MFYLARSTRSRLAVTAHIGTGGCDSVTVEASSLVQDGTLEALVKGEAAPFSEIATASNAHSIRQQRIAQRIAQRTSRWVRWSQRRSDLRWSSEAGDHGPRLGAQLCGVGVQ